MLLLLVAVVLLIPIAPANAVVAKAISHAALAQEADVVVVGRVVEMKTIVANGQVWTIATVSAERSLKGKPPATLRVRIPGGEQKVGGRTLVTRVEDAPVMNVNQKALFFLNHGEKDYHDLTGLNRGYWRIQNRSGREVLSSSADETSDAIPLDNFLKEIASGLKERVQR